MSDPVESTEDIFDRVQKRQEELQELSQYLFELESHLSLVFAYSPDLILLTNPSGKILRINHTVESILGYNQHEMLGKDIWEFIHPDEIEPTRRMREALLKKNLFFENGKQNFFANKWRRRNGTYARLVWRFAFYDQKNGWMIKFATDFSTTEVDNPYYTKLLCNCVNHSSGGIVITDAQLPNNPIVYVNRSFEEMSGYLSCEIVGKNCRILNQHERDQAPIVTVREAVREGKGCNVLLKNFRSDGSIWYNHLLLEPVYENDVITHFIGSSRDLTSDVDDGTIVWDKTAIRGFGKHNTKCDHVS